MLSFKKNNTGQTPWGFPLNNIILKLHEYYNNHAFKINKNKPF